MKFFLTITIIGLFFILSFLGAKAQISYKNGYIITHTGDSINGSIGVKQLNQDYKYCYFKTKKLGKIQSYNPNDILIFCIPNSLLFISTSELKVKGENKVFAQILIDGEVTLIKYRKEYFIKRDGKIIILEGDFKQVLSDLMKDCKSVKYKIMMAKKESSSLSEIVFIYNNYIKSDNKDYNYQPPDFIVTPSLRAGIISSQLLSDITTKDGNSQTHKSQNQQLVLGMNVDFMLTKLSKRFSIGTGATYYNSEYLIDFSADIIPKYSSQVLSTIYEETKINFSTVEIPIYIKYQMNIGSWDFHAHSGLAYNLILNPEYETVIEKQTENIIETSPFESTSTIDKGQTGLFISAGIDRAFLKRMNMGLEITAQMGGQMYSNVNDYYTISSKTKSLFTILYLRF